MTATDALWTIVSRTCTLGEEYSARACRIAASVATFTLYGASDSDQGVEAIRAPCVSGVSSRCANVYSDSSWKTAGSGAVKKSPGTGERGARHASPLRTIVCFQRRRGLACQARLAGIGIPDIFSQPLTDLPPAEGSFDGLTAWLAWL